MSLPVLLGYSGSPSLSSLAGDGQAAVLLLLLIMIIFLVIAIVVVRHVSEKRKKTESFAKRYTANDPKFLIGQKLYHEKSRGLYYIVGLPSTYLIEATREPAYAYSKYYPIHSSHLGSQDNRIFIRAQHLMEDGRFLVVS